MFVSRILQDDYSVPSFIIYDSQVIDKVFEGAACRVKQVRGRCQFLKRLGLSCINSGQHAIVWENDLRAVKFYYKFSTIVFGLTGERARELF